MTVTSKAQINIGMRINVMPGARILTMVTKKFSALITDETPRISRPTS